MSGTRTISTTSRRKLSSSIFFPARQGTEGNLSILTETLAFFLPGRAKDLSAPLYFSTHAKHLPGIFMLSIACIID